MEKYVCPCGYEYKVAEGDPDNGVAPNTPWGEVPADWVCPVCGLGKEEFTKEWKGAVKKREFFYSFFFTFFTKNKW